MGIVIVLVSQGLCGDLDVTYKGGDLEHLVEVRWLRLHAPNTGCPGSIPGQGAISHMLLLRVCMPSSKILHIATKDPECHN